MKASRVRLESWYLGLNRGGFDNQILGLRELFNLTNAQVSEGGLQRFRYLVLEGWP